MSARGSVRYELATAIVRMAGRHGEAEREGAYAFDRYLEHRGNPEMAAAHLAKSERFGRAARRQLRAVQRLADALRDLEVSGC